MPRKLTIITKNASNKSCSEFSFRQKNQWAHMSITPRSGELGGSLQFQYIIIFQTWQYLVPPSSTPGEDRHMRQMTFSSETKFRTTFI